jgi:hypothetical protein
MISELPVAPATLPSNSKRLHVEDQVRSPPRLKDAK